MKKISLLMLVVVLSIAMFGCPKSSSGAGTESGADTSIALGDLEVASTLKTNFAMGNNARTMTYQKSTPLTLPDGTVVTQGDLKPTWQYISAQLGVQIVDAAVQDQKASEMIDIAAATAFSDATIYGGNSIADSLMNYGAQGYLLNLKDYLDYMPDFKAYLTSNPNIAKAITAYDGGIYHVPYAAEIGNYARAFECRGDWVTSLLDSDSMIEAETHTLTVAYEGYWDRYKDNVIGLQNAAAAGGVLDAATARTVLLSYIKATHPGLAKPSDLFLGETAVYDIDELIALLRVIELSPNTLSKVSTGSVVEGTEISPYFVRKASYREDLFRLLNYFDGQRVHGSDSYAARFYVDENGKLVYSYADPSFLTKINYLKEMFSEGLIHSEFADTSVKDEFRKSMFFADAIDGQKQFGFLTFDWFASTTGGSPKIVGMLPPVTTITKAGINDFVHYIENSRAIKPDGWSISAKAADADRNAAFKLFNYMFTEEGNKVQNYSIPSAHLDGEVFVGPDGTEYPKFNQWIRDAAAEFKNGDMSGFLRDFMGSHLALGYQKEIGFELQTTKPNGFDAWALYNKMDVMISTYEQENEYLRMMPPIISLTEQNLAKLATVSVGNDQTDKLFQYITGLDTEMKDANELTPSYADSGLETYLSVYQSAYSRMMGE